MPKHISRSRVRTIQLRSQHRAQVPNANLHSISRCALGLSTNVDSGPAEDQGNGGVDADGCEKGSHVRNTWSCFGVGVSEEDNVADDCDGGGGEDEEGAAGVAFRKDGPKDCEEGCDGVGGDGEELGLGGCVAHVADNCWLGWC